MQKKRRVRLLCAALGLFMMLSACGVAEVGTKEAQSKETVVFTDALGEEVRVASPQKVAVVMGSFAEVWQLAGGTLAAATEDAFADERVEKAEGIIDLGAMKSPSVELMIANGIDFVVLSSNISEHVALREQLKSIGMNAAYFDVETFDEYLSMLKTCTDITGRADLYKTNGEDIKARIAAAIAAKEGHDAPRVLFLRAFSSGVKAKGSDSMTGVMLMELGCENIADREGSLLDDLSMEVIVREDPDFIFVTTMGSSDDAAIEALRETLTSNPAWSQLTAVLEDRYILLPKELFHLKPNARWAESYEMLAVKLYGKP